MFARIILGFPLVYLVSGFPLARLFLPEERTLSLKLILTSFGFSLFLTYPAAVLTTIMEGQSAAAIYSVHLPNSLFSIVVLSAIAYLVLRWKNRNWYRFHWPKIRKEHLLLMAIIGVYSFFVFWNLGRADNIGDDYDLAYQAYNLQDGIMAARKAYVISFGTHPPMMMTIKHYDMQLFSPWGLQSLSDWMFRGVEGIMGIGIILGVYLMLREFFSRKTALVAALVLGVNNYLIFYGRYFEREIYLTFFLVMAAYYFLSHLKKYSRGSLLLSVFFLGCGFLVKTSALPLFGAMVVMLVLHCRYREVLLALGLLFVIYLPVIIFNVGAYLTTGFMDGTFSRIFGITHPLATEIPKFSFLVNPAAIFFLLADLFGIPVLFLFLIGVARSFWRMKKDIRVKFMFIWLVFMIVFFSFSPMRAYYLLLFIIPLVVMFSVVLAGTKNPLKFLVLTSLVVYSVYYSFNSNLRSQKDAYKYNDYGARADNKTMADNFWHLDYSYAAAAFSREEGWKTLQSRLGRLYEPGACLEMGKWVSDLPIRRYLGTADGVKLALLGKNYPHKYLMCSEVTQYSSQILIYYDEGNRIQVKKI